MNESLMRKLNSCTALPTLPAIAVKILQVANNPATTPARLADCIATDPALSAKLLKLSNSPLYLKNRPNGNLRHVVDIMGSNTVVTIALSLSLVQNLKNSGDEVLFWRRSLHSALACRVLAQRFGFNQDDLLLAGLLQDIGILALRSLLPEEYTELHAITIHDELLQAEREKFGSGHDEVGYWLLKQWGLPDHLALACLASHGVPPLNGASPTPISCVAVSGYFADAFYRTKDLTALRRVTDVALRWVGLDAVAILDTLQSMGNYAKEYECILDMQVIDENHAEAVLHEMKELIAIENLIRWRDAEEKMQRDTLTDSYNRVYFDEVFRQAFSVSTRHGWPLSVAFIDVDNFKHINDTYGHSVGDDMLVALSRLITSQVRSGDVFARYGGEEFVVLFPGTTDEAAWSVLSRIREAVESLPHFPGGSTYHMTISVGLACHMDAEQKYESKDDMLHAADNALYAAKRNGRNQIVRAVKL